MHHQYETKKKDLETGILAHQSRQCVTILRVFFKLILTLPTFIPSQRDTRMLMRERETRPKISNGSRYDHERDRLPPLSVLSNSRLLVLKQLL